MRMPTLTWEYSNYGWEAEQRCDICGKWKPVSVLKTNAYQKRGKRKKKYKVTACYRCYYGRLTNKKAGK